LIHELSNDLPNQSIIHSVITECFDDLMSNGYEINLDLNTSEGEKLVRSSQGLTIEEIRDAIRLSAVADGGITINCYQRVSQLKINKLRKLQVEFSEPPDVSVGGLDNLKQWINQRSKLFSQQLSNSKLPSPKGIMLVGVPGTGKSLVAKTIGQMWSIPILKLDMGNIYNSLVGESEKNMRVRLKTAEAIAPCILWMDEIEKGLAGSSGGNDSGVSQRVFGQFLTWMSDHKAPVFVVATANDISSLPPELSRKGRFDEVFFVDLPNQNERSEILALHLNRHDVILTDQELEALAQLAENFSGAELAGIVDDSAIACFDDDRYPNINYQDIEKAIKATVPLAIREKEKIAGLKAWAFSSARLASVQVISQKKTRSKGSKQVQML
jgi:SpoVK/Ycf46/Vps4 family AAA+-type ATPase